MKIQIKHSTQLSGSSAVAPVAQYMLDGELALNFNATDPRLFAKLSNGSIGNIPIANHTNAFWHQGNDGAGSGLDADLLDGQQGSYFLNYNNFSNTPTIPTNNNQLTNGAGYVTSSGNTTIGTSNNLNTSGANIIDFINVTDGVITQMGQRTLTLADLGYTGAPNANYITNNNQIANGAGYINDITTQTDPKYLRSNTSDTFSGGTLTINGGSGLAIKSESTGFAEQLEIHRNHPTQSPGIKFSNDTGQIGILFAAQSGYVLRWRDGTSTNSNKIWHSGNDSSGSGLDADLLDGQQGSYYWNPSNDGSASGLDADLLDGQQGSYYWNPSNDGANSGLDADTLDGQQGSYYLDYNNLNNKPTSSGNADTLDNLESSQFLRSDVEDQATVINIAGELSPNSSAKLQVYGFSRMGPIMLATGTASTTSFNTTNERWIMNNGSHLYASTASGSYNNKIWVDGNDGSGSGLDADILDGYQLSGSDSISTKIFNNKGQTHGTVTNFNTSMNPGANFLQGGTNGPTGSGQWYGFMLGLGSDYGTTTGTSGHYASQLYWGRQSSTSNNPYLWARDLENGSWGSWRKFSAGNADTIDGIAGSNLCTLNGNQTITGQKIFTSSGTNTSVSALSIESTAQYTFTLKHTTSGSGPVIAMWEGGQSAFRARIGWSPSGYLFLENNETDDELRIGNNLEFVQGSSVRKVWHAANDGSGSGLDADTLDGINSGSFLRSDATNSGTVTFDGGSSLAIKAESNDFAEQLLIHRNHASNAPAIRFSNDTAQTGILFGDSSGNIQWRMGTSTTNNKIWHAGNDGSGSSLDADLWDGNQFSSYLNQALLTTSSPTFGNVYANDWFRNNNAGEGLYNQSTQRHFFSAGSNYWHINSGNGLVFYDAYNSTAGNSTNRKGYIYFDGNGFGVLGSSGGWAVNIPNGTSTVIIGGQANGNHYNTTSSTRLSFGGGNDINNYFIGTNMEDYGGNYTKLDLRWHTGIRMGAQAQYGGTRIFNNEDLSTLLFSVGRGDGHTRIESGSLICQGAEEKIILRGTNNPYIRFEEGTTDKAYIQWSASLGEILLVNQEHDRRLVISTATNGLLYYRGNLFYKVWESGNDGSGSGLDADTVDGIQGASLLRSDTSDVMSGELNVTRNSGVTGSSAPTYSQVNIEMQTSSNHVPALGFHRGGYSATTLYEYNGELYVNAWVSRAQTGKLVSFGNDGSGSGLDADTVDGIQGGSLLRSDASDTVSAGVIYSWSATNTEGLRFTNSSYSKSLYIGGWTTSNSAGISRIRNSNDNLHLDSGSAGNLYLNHYSTGTIYMRGSTAWHAGNDGSGSGLDADTLDGVSSGSFLRSDANDSYSGTINGTGSFAVQRQSSYTPGAGNSNTGIVLRGTGISYFSYNGVAAYFNRNSNGDLISYRRSGTEEGSIEINTSRVYYRTTSDYRRKTNVTPIANGIDVIKALKPSAYNWIEDNRLDHGFLAHEIQEHIPGSASGFKDEVDEEGEPVYQKVDLTTVVPFLTAALKDSIARIESLEATVAALQNA